MLTRFDYPLRKRYRAPAAPFAHKYTAADVGMLVELLVELFVELDRAHEDVCGPAIAHLLQRAHTVYGDPRYEGRADLSASHLYNLRKRVHCQVRRVSFVKTRALCNPIGIHKAPSLNGRAGFVRVDTLYQGVQKLLVEQTRSRSRHSDGNALAESKLPVWCVSRWATATSRKSRPNPYAKPVRQTHPRVLPSGVQSVAESTLPVPVRQRHRHEDVKTPLAALTELCDKGLARLKDGVTLAALQALADAPTDLAASQAMQRAKAELFQLINATRARVNKAA